MHIPCYRQVFIHIINIKCIKMTALKELEIFIENLEYNYLNRELLDFANKVKERINQLQVVEKEQIEKAYTQGNEDGFHSTESKSDYEIEGRDKYFSEKYFQDVYEPS